jgi:hypothetical protein
MQPADGKSLPVRPGKIGISRLMAVSESLHAALVFSTAFFAMSLVESPSHFLLCK